MDCPSIAILTKTVTFHEHTALGSGPPVDTDALPTYKVYEDETQTAILSGTMAKQDDAGTTGFYSETLNISAANGFESYKTYNVRAVAAIGGVALQDGASFQCFTVEAGQYLVDGAIGNAEVLAVVNARLARDDESCTTQLRGVLKALTGAMDLLENDEDGVLAAEADSVSLPTDYKSLISVTIGDEPLGKIDYVRDYLARDENAAAGEPEGYCVWNGEILFDKVADQEYTAAIHYRRFHPGDVSEILLPDEWRFAIYHLTTAAVLGDLGLFDKAKYWDGKGAAEVERLRPTEHSEPRFVGYTDI